MKTRQGWLVIAAALILSAVRCAAAEDSWPADALQVPAEEPWIRPPGSVAKSPAACRMQVPLLAGGNAQHNGRSEDAEAVPVFLAIAVADSGVELACESAGG